MFKNMIIKKMLKAQGIDEAQADKVLLMMEKDPELFKRIATEIEERVKGGKDKVAASLEVMQKYEKELKELNS